MEGRRIDLQPHPHSQPVRIVSLLSSATEIVTLLGLQDHLVGISHECDFPPEVLDRPRVSRVRFDPQGLDSAGLDAAVRRAMEEHGSVYEVDVELLRRLRPDVVLTQAVCEVCAVPTGSVQEAVAGLEHVPEVVSLDAHTVEEIVESVRTVGEAAGVADRGAQRAGELQARLDAVARAVAGAPRPRALLLEWLDPPFLPGHWVPQMVELAGGQCILGEAGERSLQVPWDEVVGLDPDLLLIEPCGYDLAAARADADRCAHLLRAAAPRAVADGRAWALDSAWFSRSGPRVVAGIECLANLFHPAIFPNRSGDAIAVRWG